MEFLSVGEKIDLKRYIKILKIKKAILKPAEHRRLPVSYPCLPETVLRAVAPLKTASRA